MSVIKPASILLAGRMAGFAFNLLTPMIMVRAFSQAEFGTYKQFLLIYTTLYAVAQLGMAESLYYFLPLDPQRSGKYLLNSLLALAGSGLCCLLGLGLTHVRIGLWLSNPALPQYVIPLGLYLLFMLVSTPLEIVLIVRHHYIKASAIYAASDVARTIVVVVPALLRWGLRGVFWGAVVFTALRLCLTLVFALREFKVDLRINVLALRRHLAYAAPFALWVVADIASTTLPQYLVASKFDSATFAIFSVACLQIPVVDFVLASAGTVMMVKMAEALREGRTSEVVALWHDTTRKLALILFPMVALLVLLARELITFLFTANYSASAPLFMLWCTLILLVAVPVEGVLRSLADTRLLLWFSIVKLLIIAACGVWGLRMLGLAGVILATVAGASIYKLLGLCRLKYTVPITLRELLPWAPMANTMICAAAAAVPALLIRARLEVPLLPLMVIMSTSYFLCYVVLSHRFGLMNVRELLATAFKAFSCRMQWA